MNHLGLNPITGGLWVSLDKVAVTFDVPAQLRVQLIARIRSHAPYYREGTRWYEHFARFPLGEYGHKFLDPTRATEVQLFAGPRRPGSRFARIEFNPNRAPIHLVRGFLSEVLGVGWGLIQMGTASHLHVAVDIPGVRIADLSLHVPKVSVTRQVSKSGRSNYVGSCGSARSFCCYDKRAEIVAHNRRLPHSLRQPVPGFELTRIEARLRPRVPIHCLPQLSNAFSGLTVSMIPEPKKVAWDIQLALRLSNFVGINGTLPALPASKRKELMALLEAGRLACWDPEVIWRRYIALASELCVAEVQQAA